MFKKSLAYICLKKMDANFSFTLYIYLRYLTYIFDVTYIVDVTYFISFEWIIVF